MLRVHACAEAASTFCGAVAPISANALISAVLRTLESPQRELRANALSGLETLVADHLTAALVPLTASLASASGVRQRSGEDVARYIERAMRTMTVRGTRRGAATAAARQCADVADCIERLETGVLYEQLAAVFDADVDDISVDAAVERLKRSGVDGEQLAWTVITRESIQHIMLVRKEANRAARMWSDRAADDLVGYAWRGLRLALRSYNPDTAWFSTYACPKIRGAIRDGVRNEHHLPKRLNTFVNKVERARDELAAALGRHPTQAEVAERLGIEVDRVAATATYATPTSLDATEDDEQSIQVPSGADVEADVLARYTIDTVRAALNDLPSDDAEAVQLLVMEQLPMREARERTGASPKQLRARRDRGLAALRSELEPLL